VARRGLLVMGAVGTGKTTALKGVWKPGVAFDLGSAGTPELTRLNDWRADGGDLQGDVLLDRLGRESEEYLLDYNKRDVVGQFLLRSWEAWRAGAWRGRLFAATEYTEEEIAERYGGDVAVRLGFGGWRGLCVPVKFAAEATWEPASAAAARKGQIDDGSDYVARDAAGGEAGRRLFEVWRSPDGINAALRIAVVNLRALSPEEAGDTWVALVFKAAKDEKSSRRVQEVVLERLRDVVGGFLEGDAEGAARAAMAAYRYARKVAEGSEKLHGEKAVEEAEAFAAAAGAWTRAWSWEAWAAGGEGRPR
ncbi:MAG: hypothetical protein IK066_11735, partial [Kiritimatiellae bacterium]|nr:hypothetical protein [Kiritimatiellia bacterium]